MFDNFKAYISNDVDAILISSQENRNYFTGFEASDGYLLITKNKTVFLTDSRYIEAAQNSIDKFEVREFYGWRKQASALIEEFKIKKLGVEADRLTVSQFMNLKNIFGTVILTVDGVDAAVNSMRAIKNKQQLSNVISAQRIAEKAFEHILGFIKPGITEKAIALELDFFMLKNGAQRVSFETIAISGQNTSMPHGVPSEKVIENGDFITMDFGAVVNSYHSDMTRTVAVGSVSSKQEQIYNIVLNAQNAVFPLLKDGANCAQADNAARSVIEASGFGSMFRHSTGHGVGVEIHEKPVLSPNSNEILKAGNIVTNEPGIYIPGEFGVRIEDMVYITENGFENLTKAEKQLIVL